MCRDVDNQYRFEAAAERCHASYALAAAQAKDRDSDEVAASATAWSARLKAPTGRH